MYVKWKDDKQQTSLDAVKTNFAGEEAFLLKVTFTDGKTLYDWFFLKGDLVYRVAIEGIKTYFTKYMELRSKIS